MQTLDGFSIIGFQSLGGFFSDVIYMEKIIGGVRCKRAFVRESDGTIHMLTDDYGN